MDVCKLRIELHQLVDRVEDTETLLQVFVILTTSAALQSVIMQKAQTAPEIMQ